MHIEWLQVRNVRNLSHLRIEPNSDLNIICGPNGSGKTALLEAIHFLGRCRSFRTAGINRVIRHHQKELRVSAGMRMPDQSLIVTGVERSRAAINIRYNNQTVRKVSEQAAQIPVITITPDSHKLVSGSPVYRRRWLDWAMFHVKPNYIETWRDYYKALKNRNSLLRRNKTEQLETWEQSMSRAAEIINAQRNTFINELSNEMIRTAQQLKIPAATLEYDSGWQPGEDLAQVLATQRKADLERRVTRYGAHRSDLMIRQDGKDIGHFYSRGQIKLCIIALSLAQESVYRHSTGRSPIILLDDFAAELDVGSQQRVIDVLSNLGGQVFITTTGKIPARAKKKAENVSRGTRRNRSVTRSPFGAIDYVAANNGNMIKCSFC